ncbi:MAG: 50S ribosomal protein L3 N(5)-glutamine methyltransferase [Pseudomonadota bacterium]
MPRQSARPRTLNEYLVWGARAFKRARLYYGHGTDNAADDSFQLVLSVLAWPVARAQRQLNRALTQPQSAAVMAAFRQRMQTRRPSAYLTGEAWFAGLRFHVDSRVLIPRSPIAELIAARFQPWLTQSPRRILDLCAGSGCIGIACAKTFSKAHVDLGELDQAALVVAQRNIRRHRLGKRTTAVESDLFKALVGRKYDLIVSNPPYVPLAEWKRLPAEYRHEPRKALEAGRDGMDIVARILDEAALYLAPMGLLVCEIGGSMREFEKRFPRFPALWPEFERGGDGVFIITREELLDWKRKSRVR